MIQYIALEWLRMLKCFSAYFSDRSPGTKRTFNIKKRGTVCHVSVIRCLGIPMNEDVVITAPRICVETITPFSCIRDIQFPKL